MEKNNSIAPEELEVVDIKETKGLGGFVKASYEEVAVHTTWPARNELISSALLVLLASFIFAIFIGAMDAVFENLMKAIYSI